MTKDEIEKEKNLMIAQIKKYSPIFKRFFELDLSLKEYSKGIYNFIHHPVYIKRQAIVKAEILKKFEKIFGPDCQERLNIKLDEQLACNIVDHHQILNHPLLISDNVIANIPKFFKAEKPLKGVRRGISPCARKRISGTIETL